MPCRLLFDSLSTPVSGSIVKAILSFPETMLYLEGLIHIMFVVRVVLLVVVSAGVGGNSNVVFLGERRNVRKTWDGG